MWNNKKSVILSLVVCFVIAVLLTLTLLNFSSICEYYFENYRGIGEANISYYKDTIALCFYPGCVMGYIALYSLIKLLLNIRKDDIFIIQNVKYLRILSWCCFGVSLITLICVIKCPTLFALLVICAASGFIGLILRVVKNVIEAAVDIRMENDLTI